MYNVLRSQARSGTDLYRARGTFATSLVCAEYMAIVFPLLIHAMLNASGFWRKGLLCLGMAAVLTAMWLTGSRSAMIGFFLAVFLYGGSILPGKHNGIVH